MSGLTISIGLYLLTNALLRSLIKVKEVCRCQILLLGILQILLLAIIAKSLKSFCGIFSQSWVQPVRAFHNVLAINEFRLRVQTATAKEIDIATLSATTSS